MGQKEALWGMGPGNRMVCYDTKYVTMFKQTRSWDPLLCCLHLDKGPLEQQNTKKLKGTKNNCMGTSLVL